MDVTLWNAALSLISALILFWVKISTDEVKRIQILLNRTREEIAKEYVTKAERRPRKTRTAASTRAYGRGIVEMDVTLWNAALSLISALILFWVKISTDEVKRIQILLNRTREEIAKEYVTKAEVHTDINRVLDRLDRLEKKIDDFMKEQRSALS